MAKEKLSMRKFKEVLRLKFETDLSNRQIAKSCSTSHVTVGKYLALAEQAALSWPLPDNLDDAEIENRLVEHVPRKPSQKPAMPSMQYLHQELKRKHVTLQLLWYEYKQQNPDGYQYSYFCELYSQWVKKLDVCLRQHHRAGEKAFIDYAGQTVAIIDSETGTLQCDAQIFIATLGGPAIIPLPKPALLRACQTGLPLTSGPLNFSTAFRKYWCPIILNPVSANPVAMNPM
jgi:hypothetical protein